MKKEQDTINNQNVSEALELLAKTLAHEKERIFQDGSKAMAEQDTSTARAVLDFADKLKLFTDDVQNLIAKWSELLKEREAASPAVQEIVTGEGRLFKPRSSTRTMTGPRGTNTNFTVAFADGTCISAAKACDVLCQAIEKIGPARVAPLCELTGEEPILVNGEPLIARSQGGKYPRKEIKDGYWVQAHSSTGGKIAALQRISKKLNLDLKITPVQN